MATLVSSMIVGGNHIDHVCVAFGSDTEVADFHLVGTSTVWRWILYLVEGNGCQVDQFLNRVLSVMWELSPKPVFWGLRDNIRNVLH